MPEITIDYNIYLPTPSTYLSYFEVLKSHQFVDDPEVSQEVLDLFLDVIADESEILI
ncbi:hypothetical protein NEF87_001934 [Candidatus Lokiarchaeum ossiferum]|uniref:Uncharacterized protein n=1 Tax=Candidatus Lokiarchaeum ossiferum TaxID=2951803 RepID=A0ABY6HSV4_9ARCH|nr:hypothetical protein NEF87_001934 [Candidatus Lokiarchaeum sp. B-35]